MASSSSTLTKKAYRHLLLQLSSGHLQAGTVVSEMKIADELGISRTPVGQAIRQLVSEGLMEQLPRYGTMVKEITKQDIKDLYELREAMEPYAANNAAKRITPPQLEQLAILCRSIEHLAEALGSNKVDALEGRSLQEFLSADLAFHLYILRAAENKRMLKIAKESRFVSRVFHMRRMRHDIAIVLAANEFHNRILSALRAGDGAAAAKHSLEHIRRSKQETLAFFDQQQEATWAFDSSLDLELSDGIREEFARIELEYNE